MNRLRTAPLLVLFGVLYFVQGIVEPSGCLPSQPLQTQLRAWRFSPTEIGYFFGVIGIGWSIKPLFGLISDFCPVAGRRRRPYLILATAATAVSFLVLALVWLNGSVPAAIWILVAAGLGVAMTDVVVDAVGVERGQALGITGEIQAVQWGALSVAGLVVGSLGGYIAQHGLQTAMFAGCAALAGISLVMVVWVVREPRQDTRPRDNLRLAWQQAWVEGRLGRLAAVAAFLFLWNFNPFSSNVLQEYATGELRFSEQFFGHLGSLQAVGHALACVAYFTYCRRVPMRALLHWAILTGIVSTVVYWWFRDHTSAIAASLVFGFAYQTGLLIQLDLAARLCPTQSAATTFAILTAISNCGVFAATMLGGAGYEGLSVSLGSRTAAYHALVGIGAACTAACWLVVPLISKVETLRGVGES